MEEVFGTLASYVALLLEALAVWIIAVGACGAVAGLLHRSPDFRRTLRDRKGVWVRFGVWLLIGLEFELAADVVRTAISPTWQQIGQLASIALVRTFLNYFLEKDIEKYEQAEPRRVVPAIPASQIRNPKF